MTRQTQRDFFRLLFRHKKFGSILLNMLTMIGSASCCPSHRLPLRLPWRTRRRRSRPTGTGPSFACRNRMSEIYVEWKSPEKYGEVSFACTPREMLTFCCRSPRGSPCSTRSRADPASPRRRRRLRSRRRRRCTSTWTRRCPSCLLAERRSRSVCSGGGAAAE